MEKGRTTKKVQKAVLRNSIVMLSLFALTVASSGVAQAQECFAFQSGANTVRAEGITEAVGEHPIAVQGPRSLWPAAHWR